jgi:hypothetical protein
MVKIKKQKEKKKKREEIKHKIQSFSSLKNPLLPHYEVNI